MKKSLAIAGLAGAALLVGGVAAADTTEQTSTSGSVVITQTQSSTATGSSDCLPASVKAQFPWLPVPVCP